MGYDWNLWQDMDYSRESLLPDANTTELVGDMLFRRHLGLPDRVEFGGRLQEVFESTRQWYTRHGSTHSQARYLEIQRFVYDVIHLPGPEQLSSTVLARALDRVGAHAIVVVGISVSDSVQQRIADLTRQNDPDGAMFLNAYALATVEDTRARVTNHLRQLFSQQAITVLPPYVPEYDTKESPEQRRILRLLKAGQTLRQPQNDTPAHLDTPADLGRAQSLLAVFGLTRRQLAEPLDSYWTCRVDPTAANGHGRGFAFPEKALRRWCDQRLKVTALSPGEVRATFSFEGSTCSNMGMPLAFDYHVSLQHSEGVGYRVVDTQCLPAENHTGYRSTCAYLADAERFMSQLSSHRPLVGIALNEALTWTPTTSPAGCLCSRASQDHKWRIVLQTLYYALNQRS